MLPIRPLAYADSSIETNVCTGPRYTRTAPSRETPGILLNDVTDKYVTEFNLPYMNVARYIKEIDSNWTKLNQDQKNIILQSIAKFQQNQLQIQTQDTFANDGTDGTDPNSTYLSYLQTTPKDLGPFLNNIKHSGNPILVNQLNNFMSGNSWSSMIIVFLLIICIIVLIYVKFT